MSSYTRWNVIGVVIAIVGFVIGSLRGTMGGGGIHTTLGALLGLTGAGIAVSARLLARRRRRQAARA